MAVETTRWGVLYCPKTGISNTRKRWEKIEAVLKERGVSYDMVQSETAESVERLMTMLINNGYKTIIVVGGDSALNDAVNCLMKEEKRVREEIALGVVPNGVMNDFARFWDFDEDRLEQTVDWLVKRRIRKIDLGCIRYTNKNGEKVYRISDSDYRYASYSDQNDHNSPFTGDTSTLMKVYPDLRSSSCSGVIVHFPSVLPLSFDGGLAANLSGHGRPSAFMGSPTSPAEIDLPGEEQRDRREAEAHRDRDEDHQISAEFRQLIKLFFFV